MSTKIDKQTEEHSVSIIFQFTGNILSLGVGIFWVRGKVKFFVGVVCGEGRQKV